MKNIEARDPPKSIYFEGVQKILLVLESIMVLEE